MDLGRFWGRFGGSGGTIWEVGGELGHMYVKKGGGVFLNHPFWAVGGSFGHEKWARELARRCPEDPKIGRSRPEERAKRLCEEKIVKPKKRRPCRAKCVVLVAGKGRKSSEIGPEVAWKA